MENIEFVLSVVLVDCRSLSCGSISALGRFESELLDELRGPAGEGAIKGASRLSRTIRMLTNREEDKVKGEEASLF